MICERAFSAEHINTVLNDPFVRPDVADLALGTIDVTQQIANHNNVLLTGEHGGMIFFKRLAGVYEVHTVTNRFGRGKWVIDFAHAAAQWMFTRTDCYEIVTRVPEKHHGARALSFAAGMRKEFARPNGCVWREQKQAIEIWSYRIQDWIKKADALEEIGRDFHDFLHEEAARLSVIDAPHPDDPAHNRYVGAVAEMIRHDQVQKGINFYNRWALISRQPTVELLHLDPVMIKFDLGVLVFEDGKPHVERMAA